MSESIYGQRPRAITSVPWSPAPRTCAATVHTSSTIAAGYDARLLAILEAPMREPTQAGFARKERELGEAFAALPVFDQRALQARLSVVRPGDVLAEKFNRLTHERRQRLLNFLGDARRRAAQSNARSK